MKKEKGLAYREPRDIAKEREIIKNLPLGRMKILDFRGETGALGRMIKSERPDAVLYMMEENVELLVMAMKQHSADNYMTHLDHIPDNYFDVIIVPKEVILPENYSTYKYLKRRAVLGGLLTVRN